MKAAIVTRRHLDLKADVPNKKMMNSLARKSKSIIPLMLFVLITIPELSISASPPPSSLRNSALILLPNARKVWSGQVGATFQLSYGLDQAYPATQVINEISKALQDNHWSSLDHDYLNPNLPISQVRAWSDGFIQDPKHPDICVYMWTGYWQNSRGDLVRYAFRYQHLGCDTKDISDLEVFAALIPAKVAHEIHP